MNVEQEAGLREEAPVYFFSPPLDYLQPVTLSPRPVCEECLQIWPEQQLPWHYMDICSRQAEGGMGLHQRYHSEAGQRRSENWGPQLDHFHNAIWVQAASQSTNVLQKNPWIHQPTLDYSYLNVLLYFYTSGQSRTVEQLVTGGLFARQVRVHVDATLSGINNS